MDIHSDRNPRTAMLLMPLKPFITERQPACIALAFTLLAGIPAAAWAGDTSAAAELARFQAQAAGPADAARGQTFFNSTHGGRWSCASCHGQQPVTAGRHAATGKVIEPLAPTAQPSRFTDRAKVDKWFRRNCRDVLARECSAGEKADVVAWLMQVR
jgi:mono/diheme cytochrome c family protein